MPDGGVHAPEGGGHRGPDDVHGRKAAAGHGLAEAAQLVVEGVDARQDQAVLVGEDVVEVVDALELQRSISKNQPVNKGLKDWAFFTFAGKCLLHRPLAIVGSAKWKTRPLTPRVSP